MCMPWLPGERLPPETVSTVTVANPPEKSMVALATGLPSGDFSSALMVWALEPDDVVVVVCWLPFCAELQPARTSAGAAMSAAAAVARFNMRPGIPVIRNLYRG